MPVRVEQVVNQFLSRKPLCFSIAQHLASAEVYSIQLVLLAPQHPFLIICLYHEAQTADLYLIHANDAHPKASAKISTRPPPTSSLLTTYICRRLTSITSTAAASIINDAVIRSIYILSAVLSSALRVMAVIIRSRQTSPCGL